MKKKSSISEHICHTTIRKFQHVIKNWIYDHRSRIIIRIAKPNKNPEHITQYALEKYPQHFVQNTKRIREATAVAWYEPEKHNTIFYNNRHLKTGRIRFACPIESNCPSADAIISKFSPNSFVDYSDKVARLHGHTTSAYLKIGTYQKLRGLFTTGQLHIDKIGNSVGLFEHPSRPTLKRPFQIHRRRGTFVKDKTWNARNSLKYNFNVGQIVNVYRKSLLHCNRHVSGGRTSRLVHPTNGPAPTELHPVHATGRTPIK